MNALFLNLLGFITCTIIILISGARLSKYGDMMADMLGWGKMFIDIT